MFIVNVKMQNGHGLIYDTFAYYISVIVAASFSRLVISYKIMASGKIWLSYFSL